MLCSISRNILCSTNDAVMILLGLFGNIVSGSLRVITILDSSWIKKNIYIVFNAITVHLNVANRCMYNNRFNLLISSFCFFLLWNIKNISI